MYDYTICNMADEQIFLNQCAALEKHIPNLIKKELVNDVDDSIIQVYAYGEKEIAVINDIEIDAVYIKSEISLEQFFEKSVFVNVSSVA